MTFPPMVPMPVGRVRLARAVAAWARSVEPPPFLPERHQWYAQAKLQGREHFARWLERTAEDASHQFWQARAQRLCHRRGYGMDVSFYAQQLCVDPSAPVPLQPGDPREIA